MQSLDPRGWAPGIFSSLPYQCSWNYTVRIAVKKIKTLKGSIRLGYTQRSHLWLPCWALCLPRLEDLFMVWRAHESFKAVPIPAGGFSPKNQHDITEEQCWHHFSLWGTITSLPVPLCVHLPVLVLSHVALFHFTLFPTMVI